MNILSFVFYFLEIIAALSAIGLALVRNVFYGALLLIVCLLAIAGIYVLAFAEFIAVTQILIYAGGILVVIIFGIMLTSKIAGKPMVVEHTFTFSGALVAGGFFTLMFIVLSRETFVLPASQSPISNINHTNVIGIALLTKYMMPFEIAGLLLLLALVGASVIASTIKSGKKNVSH
jgi:NADH:ubiquinone oxidoreductase subunit 6 (subunit J)